ncbi:MAG: FkbM family methyltransferase [Phycisphaerales bacterium JB060]
MGGRLLNPAAKQLRTHPRLGLLALRCIPDHQRQIEVKPIGPLAIRNRRHRGYWLRDPIDHEKFPLGVLRQCVRPSDVVWDIGANIGMYSRFEVQAFGAAHVCAFEPMQENLSLLRENIRLGGISDRVTVVPIALGDQNTQMQLQIDDVQSATAVLDVVTHGRPSEGRANVGLPPRTEEVEVRTLDSMIEQGELPEPTLLKIDVEGAEALVLRGAERYLERDDTLLLIELHGIEPGRAVGRQLLDRGYTVRGRVRREVDPSQYVPVTDLLLDSLARHYDLQFIVASRDPARVPDSVDLFS